MRTCLFEDARVADLEPLTLTRPAFELRCGLTTLGEKQAIFFRSTAFGALIRPELAAVFAERNPGMHVNDAEWLAAEATAAEQRHASGAGFSGSVAGGLFRRERVFGIVPDLFLRSGEVKRRDGADAGVVGEWRAAGSASD